MDLIALDVSGIVVDGSLLLAVPLAFLAGLVSFLSPCVLPLAPGYLAYVAGLTGSDLADEADVNLSEQQDRSLVAADGSTPGASGPASGASGPAAVVVDGSSSGAAGSVTVAAGEASGPIAVPQAEAAGAVDDSTSGASGPAAVVADGSSFGTSGSAAIGDVAARAADVDGARSGTSALAGAEEPNLDLAQEQKSSLVTGGELSPAATAAAGATTATTAATAGSAIGAAGATCGSSAALSPDPAAGSSAAPTAGAAGAEHSLPHGGSVGDPPVEALTQPDGGSSGGVQAGAPVAGVGRGRVLAGASLFVLGFSVVFVSYGAAFGGLGAWLLGHSRQISVVMGIVVIILGLGYLGLPALSNRMWWNADRRSHARPSRGLWGAPVLGVLFGLGWTPCIGPTLAAVQTLAFTEASAVRGAILSLAYCFGLGLPFIGMAVGLRAVAGATNWTKTHYLAISRFGGIMLMAIGVLLVTGWWNDIVAWLQGLVPGFTAVV